MILAQELTAEKTSPAGPEETGRSESWTRVKSRLRAKLGEDVFTSWFGRVDLEELNGAAIHFSVPTPFLRSWLGSHYSELMLAECRNEWPEVDHITFSVRQPVANRSALTAVPDAASPPPPVPPRAAAAADRPNDGDFDGSVLDPRCTFANFVTGVSNRFVHAAAQDVAASVAGRPLRYNPFYVNGNVGLGKTHLLNAIAWEVKARKPDARVVYLTAERFMSRFVQALRARDALAFKETLRGIDILLIDDMEFLQGPTIQQEFCHTLNSLIDSGRQVVVAADRAPTQLDKLDARMRSRLAGGLIAEVGAMDFELRQAILTKLARGVVDDTPGLAIPDVVLEYLATRLVESGRELEGAINRMRASFHLTDETPTLESAEQIVRDLMRGVEPKRVRIDDILRTVSKHFGVNKVDLLSSRRNRSIVWPRQIAMYLAKNLTQRSLPEIGRRFGGRDHTTVLHAIRKIENLLGNDLSLRDEVELLKRLLKA